MASSDSRHQVQLAALGRLTHRLLAGTLEDCEREALNAAVIGLGARRGVLRRGDDRIPGTRRDVAEADEAPLEPPDDASAFVMPLPLDPATDEPASVTLLLPPGTDPEEIDLEFARIVTNLLAAAYVNRKDAPVPASSATPRWEALFGALRAPCSSLLLQLDELLRVRDQLLLLCDTLDSPLGEISTELSLLLEELRESATAIREALQNADQTPDASAGDPLDGTAPARISESPKVKQVLVVDEEPVFRRAVRRALSPAVVRTCSSASEAEILLLDPNFGPALVVCNLTLPGENGHELHRRVARTRPDLAPRFVFVREAPPSTQQRAYLDSTGCQVLAKPIDPQDLRALLGAVDPDPPPSCRTSSAPPAPSTLPPSLA